MKYRLIKGLISHTSGPKSSRRVRLKARCEFKRFNDVWLQNNLGWMHNTRLFGKQLNTRRVAFARVLRHEHLIRFQMRRRAAVKISRTGSDQKINKESKNKKSCYSFVATYLFKSEQTSSSDQKPRLLPHLAHVTAFSGIHAD